MTLTKPFIEAQLAQLRQAQAKLVADAQANSGAIQVCEFLLKKLDDPEVPVIEVDDLSELNPQLVKG